MDRCGEQSCGVGEVVPARGGGQERGGDSGEGGQRSGGDVGRTNVFLSRGRMEAVDWQRAGKGQQNVEHSKEGGPLRVASVKTRIASSLSRVGHLRSAWPHSVLPRAVLELGAMAGKGPWFSNLSLKGRPRPGGPPFWLPCNLGKT